MEIRAMKLRDEILRDEILRDGILRDGNLRGGIFCKGNWCLDPSRPIHPCAIGEQSDNLSKLASINGLSGLRSASQDWEEFCAVLGCDPGLRLQKAVGLADVFPFKPASKRWLKGLGESRQVVFAECSKSWGKQRSKFWQRALNRLVKKHACHSPLPLTWGLDCDEVQRLPTPKILGICESWHQVRNHPFARLAGKKSSSSAGSGLNELMGDEAIRGWTGDVLDRWLANPESVCPIEFRILAGSIRQLARSLEYEQWSACCEQFLRLIDAANDQSDADDDGLQVDWLEAGVLLAVSVPELVEFQQLLVDSVNRWCRSMHRWLDTDGSLNHHHVSCTARLHGAWARLTYWLFSLGLELANNEDRWLHEAFSRNFVRQLRPDGNPLHAEEAIEGNAVSALVSLAFSRDPFDSELLEGLLGKQEIPSGDQEAGEAPSTVSEWAAVAALKQRWDQSATLGMVFGGNKLSIDLYGEVPILRGQIETSIRQGDVELEQSSEWAVVCEYHDGECDFLELECEFGESWVMHRQFVISRADKICLLGESLVPAGEDGQVTLGSPADRPKLEFGSAWPLRMEHGHGLMREVQTNEFYLTNDGEISTLLLPLTIGEWQSDPSASSFRVEAERIVFHSLESPPAWRAMFIDLDRRRSSKPRTWRKLTVVEDLQVCPDQLAVAYRVRVGKTQWVIYRSLGPVKNRTFLGHNLVSEFFVGRIGKRMVIEPVLEVG